MNLRITFLAAVFIFSLTVAHAENWPQWRGPNLNGVSNEKNLPVRWSPEENIKWKLALPYRWKVLLRD